MLRIEILVAGRLKKGAFADLRDEYLKRMTWPVTITEVEGRSATFLENGIEPPHPLLQGGEQFAGVLVAAGGGSFGEGFPKPGILPSGLGAAGSHVR